MILSEDKMVKLEVID